MSTSATVAEAPRLCNQVGKMIPLFAGQCWRYPEAESRLSGRGQGLISNVCQGQGRKTGPCWACLRAWVPTPKMAGHALPLTLSTLFIFFLCPFYSLLLLFVSMPAIHNWESPLHSVPRAWHTIGPHWIFVQRLALLKCSTSLVCICGICISSPLCVCVCMCVCCCFSCVTPQTVAHQAPLSMGSSQQEY